MGETMLVTLRNTWLGYVQALAVALPRLAVMASVIVIGWMIAAAARALTERVLRALRFSQLAERTGAAEVLRKAELPSAERLVAIVAFWLLFLSFLLAGLDALGLATVAALRDELGRLVPRLAASIVVFVIGIVLANVVWRIVLLAALNAGWPFARLAGGLVHALLVILAVAMALDQLGVARGVVIAAFAIVFGAVLLAVAIAVGVGAGPLVRRLLEERLAAHERRDAGGASHL